jgi:hypothetical protein
MLNLSEAVVLLSALGVREMFNLSHKEFTNSKQARFWGDFISEGFSN